MQVNYYTKYLKYKQKYLDLKEEMMSVGGGGAPPVTENIYALEEAQLSDELSKILSATKQCFKGPHKGTKSDALDKACETANTGLANEEWLKSPALKAFASPPSDASPVTSHSALKEINAAAKLQGRKTTQL